MTTGKGDSKRKADLPVIDGVGAIYANLPGPKRRRTEVSIVTVQLNTRDGKHLHLPLTAKGANELIIALETMLRA